MRLQLLGWEGPLEKEMATHSIILARGNTVDRGAWWATVHGVLKSRMQTGTHMSIKLNVIWTQLPSQFQYLGIIIIIHRSLW